MLRTRPSFDWLVAEADEEWESAVQDQESRARQSCPLKSRTALILVACLLAALCQAGIVLYLRAERNLDRIETQLGTAATAEQWTRQQDDLDLSNALIDPEAPAFWKTSLRSDSGHSSAPDQQSTIQVHDFQLDGDRALVRVRVDDPGDPWHTSPYLETRFYRRTNLGWLRTEPRLEFWGETIAADSNYFTFVYRQRDAMAVQAVMADIDERFAALCLELGAEPSSTAESLHISVQSYILPATDSGKFRFDDDRLILPSPKQMPTPIDMTEADVLRASILGPLAIRIIDSQMDDGPSAHVWPVLRDGLGLWLRQEYGVLPSATRQRLSDSLYGWQDFDSARLGFIATYSTLHAGSPFEGSANMQRQAAAYTMVSYAIETYGRSALPRLVESMHSSTTWDELIAAAFGVSVKEFEAGWRVYLAREYEHTMQ